MPKKEPRNGAGPRLSRVFHVIDSHTAGEPTRLLREGAPDLVGRSMREKMDFFRERHDDIRTTLMQEPRGNPGVLAVLVPPCDPAADHGLFFADNRGYVSMCVHGAIGVATTLIESGLVKVTQTRSTMTFDTPAGIVRATPRFAKTRLQSVAVENVSSYYVGNEDLAHPKFGRVRGMVGYGGNFYVYIDAREVGLKILPSNLQPALAAARGLFGELDRKKSLAGVPPSDIVGISFYEDLGRKHARNIMIARDDLYDRSPCGTGTSGRMAILSHQGELKVGETFANDSITGSRFTGRILRHEKVDGRPSIVPQISGSAYITSFSDIVADERDEFADGFQLS